VVALLQDTQSKPTALGVTLENTFPTTALYHSPFWMLYVVVVAHMVDVKVTIFVHQTQL
jgi:hypothetical protein